MSRNMIQNARRKSMCQCSGPVHPRYAGLVYTVAPRGRFLVDQAQMRAVADLGSMGVGGYGGLYSLPPIPGSYGALGSADGVPTLSKWQRLAMFAIIGAVAAAVFYSNRPGKRRGARARDRRRRIAAYAPLQGRA